MERCVKCGRQLQEDHKFCPECGTRIVRNEAEKKVVEANRASQSAQRDNWINVALILIIFVLLYAIFKPAVFTLPKATGNATGPPDTGQEKMPEPTQNLTLPEADAGYRGCDQWELIEDVKVINATFDAATKNMSFRIKNLKTQPVSLLRIPVTYKFTASHTGETDVIPANLTLPPKESMIVSFTIKREPHIVGIELDHCQKVKFDQWKSI